jgi:hypothetical protein
MLDHAKNSVPKPLFVRLGQDVLDLLNDEAFWSALFDEVHRVSGGIAPPVLASTVLALLRKRLARIARNVHINFSIFAQQCVATGVRSKV